MGNPSFVAKVGRLAFPIRQPPVLSISDVDSSFSHPRVNAVVIPLLEGSICPANFTLAKVRLESGFICLVGPAPTQSIPLQLLQAEIEDETRLAESQFGFPDIVAVFDPLSFPCVKGKSYDQRVVEPHEDAFQESFSPEMRPTSQHTGVRVKSKSDRQVQTNPFDLVFPVLQPPLGDNFDNPITLYGQHLDAYQGDGIRFLLDHNAALLADEMGVGKSIQAIVALRILFRQGRVSRGLIICPKSVLTDWQEKLDQWAMELRVSTVRGDRDSRVSCWNTPNHIYVASYDCVREDADHLVEKQFDFAILDEIQRIKNAEAQLTRAIKMIRPPIRWGLSGTPLENSIDDTISIFSYLEPGLLKPADAAFPSLVSQRIAPYVKRRTLEEVKEQFGLGDKVELERWLDLNGAQQAAYDKLAYESVLYLQSLGEAITVQHVLARLNLLKQICNGNAELGSGKLDYLKFYTAKRLAPGDKIIVFTQYAEKTLPYLESELREYDPLVFTGKMTDKQRKITRDTFQEDPTRRLLISSVKAGGLGLTLTAASHVFHFDHWWNPATAAQATGRSYRRGQKSTVFVTDLYASGTVEQRIHDLLREKQRKSDQVIGVLNEKALLRRLSEEELFGLFGLTPKQRGGAAATPRRITADALRKCSPIQFEDLCSRLCSKIGYYVRTTQQSHDGGVDIYAKLPTPAGDDSVIIQCKHYPDRTVGVGVVRELYGVLNSKQDIGRAVLITSGQFSSEALEFVRGKRIRLIDGTELLGILLSKNVFLSS